MTEESETRLVEALERIADWLGDTNSGTSDLAIIAEAIATGTDKVAAALENVADAISVQTHTVYD